ncbi:FAD:protein FMN transferase [Alkalibaculum bacchi]|uniref:FAD:protein FMN transferase n=1 Tax=Alkalibaculum bacchi TaxID=645887 RepID=UPI001474FBE3|nr:FAD:protein FMN transferase [Alkalibaculum bacchi]
MKKLFCILAIITTLFTIAGCTDNKSNQDVQQEYVSKTDFYLDTVVDIKIYNPNNKSAEVIDKAMERIGALEEILSIHIEGSDLWKVKENAGIKPVEVSKETMEVMKASLKYSEYTNGLFDVTTGPLVDLWAINPPNGYVPTEEELQTTLSKVNYNNMIIDEENNTIFLKDKGMIANLGAIAKGYIADEVKEILVENDVKNAIINLGGNVLLVGGKPDNSGFKIGVQDPNSDRGAYLGVIDDRDLSVVSSGDYERYFEVEGKRYHHILNPATGYPADNEIRQVTILSKLSVDGDGLSTSTFVLGLKDGMKLIESIDDVEGIFVTKDHKIYLTSGIRDSFVFDEVNYGDQYTVVK